MNGCEGFKIRRKRETKYNRGGAIRSRSGRGDKTGVFWSEPDLSAHSKTSDSKLIVCLEGIVETADVPSILHARPANFVYDAITTSERLFESCICGRDSQYTSP